MNKSKEMINQLVDVLMNKKLSIEIVESFAYIIAYGIQHEFHDLSEEQIFTIMTLLADQTLN